VRLVRAEATAVVQGRAFWAYIDLRPLSVFCVGLLLGDRQERGLQGFEAGETLVGQCSVSPSADLFRTPARASCLKMHAGPSRVTVVVDVHAVDAGAMADVPEEKVVRELHGAISS